MSNGVDRRCAERHHTGLRCILNAGHAGNHYCGSLYGGLAWKTNERGSVIDLNERYQEQAERDTQETEA